eukprot:1216816-Rhodomonas_salina.2
MAVGSLPPSGSSSPYLRLATVPRWATCRTSLSDCGPGCCLRSRMRSFLSSSSSLQVSSQRLLAHGGRQGRCQEQARNGASEGGGVTEAGTD